MKKNSRARTEDGLLTVEASVTLTSFILVILGVISVINIYIIHSKIQFAMFQAVKELSAYTYLYQVTGLRDAEKSIRDDFKADQAELNKTCDTISSFADQVAEMRDSTAGVIQSTSASGITSVEDAKNVYNEWKQVQETGKSTIESGKSTLGQIKTLVSDPMGILRGLIGAVLNEGIQGLKNWALTVVSNGMVEKYLAPGGNNKNGEAEAVLVGYGIVPDAKGRYLRFDKSSFFDEPDYKYLDLVVEYDVKIYFFSMFLKDPTLHMMQRVRMPAWLDGDGQHYEEASEDE